MTRIYFSPQNRAPKIKPPSSKSSATHPPKRPPKDNNSRSNNPKLNSSAIEEIADGLEKMVMSWNHKPYFADPYLPSMTDGYGDECHSLLSSDTIKSATVEMLEDGEFAIGTKETTISYIHQPHQHVQKHQQRTLIVDTISDNDGFVQEIVRGDVIKNSLVSIKNGRCEVIDYPPLGNGGNPTSAIWYLNPTLALPNTLNSARAQENHDVYQISSYHNDDSNGDEKDVPVDRQHQSQGHWKFGDMKDDKNNASTAPLHLEESSSKPEKISCKLEIGDSNTWSEIVEINGGDKIKELLGKKLTTIDDSSSIQGTQTLDADYYKRKVEELQIALLECAMEYEVKIVEMKMKALHTKPPEQQIEPSKETVKEDSEDCRKDNAKDRHNAHRVEYLKKQLSRLQKEKASAARELNELRKRERQFDLQRRSLDDALNRVNFLQSELTKKEHDILDCRLREKEAKAQLYELQLGLQKAQAEQIEPRKLLTLLPALKDWIHSARKMPYETQTDYLEKMDHIPHIDNIVYAITKEIQTLQNALSHMTDYKKGN